MPTFSEPWGIAAGPNGAIWTPDTTGNNVSLMTSSTVGTNYGSATSVTSPSYVAVDGAGNAWVSSGAAVAEFSKTGTILSPVSGTSPFNVVGFNHAGIQSAHGLAIDPSGDVWIANYVATTGGVFEIIGAAVPAVTPIALALKNGTVGVRP